MQKTFVGLSVRRQSAPLTKLRRLRVDRGLSLRELSSAAGVSLSYLSIVERAPHMLSDSMASKLAAALGCSADEIKE